jgi:hypothetical protein
LLTADGEIFNSRAAAEKFWFSTTAMKTETSSKLTMGAS